MEKPPSAHITMQGSCFDPGRSELQGRSPATTREASLSAFSQQSIVNIMKEPSSDHITKKPAAKLVVGLSGGHRDVVPRRRLRVRRLEPGQSPRKCGICSGLGHRRETCTHPTVARIRALEKLVKDTKHKSKRQLRTEKKNRQTPQTSGQCRVERAEAYSGTKGLDLAARNHFCRDATEASGRQVFAD